MIIKSKSLLCFLSYIIIQFPEQVKIGELARGFKKESYSLYLHKLKSVYIAFLMPFIYQAILCKGASLVRFLITQK